MAALIPTVPQPEESAPVIQKGGDDVDGASGKDRELGSSIKVGVKSGEELGQGKDTSLEEVKEGSSEVIKESEELLSLLSTVGGDHDSRSNSGKEENAVKEDRSGKSWASVAAPRSGLQKYVVEVEDINRVETIHVPDSVFENTPPLWEDCIVGKFVSKAPHVAMVHMTVNKIWTIGNKSIKVDVFVVDDTTIKFKIPDASIRARGMWSIKNTPMIVSKWRPIVEEAQPEVKSIPMWVVVRNVPRSMYSWKGLSFLTSPLGEPKQLHSDTLWAKSFDEARVFVEVNLEQNLPEAFSFKSSKGVDIVVYYEFPWLPPRCLACAKWGHVSAECRATPGDKLILRRDSLSNAAGKENGINQSGSKAEAVVVHREEETIPPVLTSPVKTAEHREQEISEDRQEKTVGPSSKKAEEKRSKVSGQRTEVSKTQETEEWEKVKSPAKPRNKAGKDKQLEADEVISPSRFTSLVSENELEEIEEGEIDENTECEADDQLQGKEDGEISHRELGKPPPGGRVLLPRGSKSSHRYLHAASNPTSTQGSGKKKKSKPRWSFMSNYEHHRLGRIWVVWCETVRITPVFKSDQMITVLVKKLGDEDEFLCSFIYGSNFTDDRRVLWEDVRSHYISPIYWNKRWIIMGDYNETLSTEEYSDPSSTETNGMRDFQELVRDGDLNDMGFHGPLFTWSNKREDGLICKNLDRVLVNENWLNDYPNSYCVFESGGCSDNLRWRFYVDGEITKPKRPFKFSNVIASTPRFKAALQEY
ncbi:uncharacterized protein LOC112082061 [Eutrema salsugineum]|uniref:uncharacterized protein LOC112082061 n=1 Tax=Eutrema salsugineum TaxID=72664 RepID=UPI000CED25BB|nr:uncharacterized protein LOC112082061 [Eutrema salsugineum]